jgi:DNA-binding transcriptional LysR family regulator
MLDPRRLLTFRSVAHAGSFSSAARELALTQPAVSQQVAALERELGERLLVRGPGGPALTPAGELALEHADALAERLALADQQLAELGDESRPLRLGAFPSALATVVPAAIASLGGRRVETVEGTIAELTDEVAAGRLHLALCFQDATAPRREHPRLTRHELGTEPFVAAVGPGHRLARRRTVWLRELAAEPWTAPSSRGLIHSACVAAGFEPDIVFLTRDVLAIRALVAGGLAVTLTSRLIAGHLEGPRILELRDEPPRRALYALTPRAGTRAAAQEFLAAVRAAMPRFSAPRR